MASLTTVYIAGIVLASCGAFGAAFLGNTIYPIKGTFGDFVFSQDKIDFMKDSLTPYFKDDTDDAVKFLTLELPKWTDLGENVGLIYKKFIVVRTHCKEISSDTAVEPTIKKSLIDLCNLMAKKYDLIIKEIEHKFQADSQKEFEYQDIFYKAYEITSKTFTKKKEDEESEVEDELPPESDIEPSTDEGEKENPFVTEETPEEQPAKEEQTVASDDMVDTSELPPPPVEEQEVGGKSKRSRSARRRN